MCRSPFPSNLIQKGPGTKHRIQQNLQIMAGGRVAVQIEAAGGFQKGIIYNFTLTSSAHFLVDLTTLFCQDSLAKANPYNPIEPFMTNKDWHFRAPLLAREGCGCFGECHYPLSQGGFPRAQTQCHCLPHLLPVNLYPYSLLQCFRSHSSQSQPNPHDPTTNRTTGFNRCQSNRHSRTIPNIGTKTDSYTHSSSCSHSNTGPDQHARNQLPHPRQPTRQNRQQPQHLRLSQS